MARPRSPDGRRVPVSYKLTEAEAEMADSLRGDTERSVYLRDAAVERMREIANSRIREQVDIGGGFKIGITVDDRQPPGTVSVISAGLEKTEVRSSALAAEEPAPKTCKHRGLRMAKGICPDCHEPVGYK